MDYVHAEEIAIDGGVTTSFSPHPFMIDAMLDPSNVPDARFSYLPCHYFDLICGTRLGG